MEIQKKYLTATDQNLKKEKEKCLKDFNEIKNSEN